MSVSAAPIRDPAVQRLLDKEAIRDRIMSYARGVDRRDRPLLADLYWPEAIDRHLSFRGSAPDFIDFAMKLMQGMLTHHMLGNVMIDFASATEAHAETYYIAAHERDAEGGRQDFIIHGRYLDLFVKRGEEWRVLERTLTCDLYSMRPSTADWANGPYAKLDTIGAAKPDDALYRAFKRS
ncbi:MAG TPA: nuclear transport factor 2 family protein [Caulobacterales bacterium]|nr:nuclear transport factor 2 family protein [Caulobacterales bacterium]